jgi:hypothetical protein
MKLSIMSLSEALIYTPQSKTYGIRIGSEFDLFHIMTLKESKNWVKIFDYYFDDVWPGCLGGITPRDALFNNQLAQKIISDFDTYKNQTDHLLVHCSAGQNRSPAVAMALNDIFNLGNNSEKLKEKYPRYNKFVYETLLKNSN